MRKAGILLAISSLPSNYGVGDFGDHAYHFIDLLKQSKVRIWQVLPLNPLGYGNSPYQPYSSNAMDEIYISLEILYKEGLIEKVPPFHKDDRKVSYQKVRKFKEKYLREAFQNFKKNKAYQEFQAFHWVFTYAVFMTLKKLNNHTIWNEWPQIQKEWIHGTNFDLSPYEKDIDYEIFIQFILYQQWMQLKTYANQNNIEIIGDFPIYVGIDSEDVYANQKNFLLDEEGRPTFIAGVPPDYFSETGQRWGNPLYDWEFMKKDKFKFWINSLRYTSMLFDCTRIDHFRAFDTYWKIPASSPNAIIGEWIEAPGYELFDTLFKEIPNLNLIAEDLGELRNEVHLLRDHYHFKGMRIVQFTFNVIEHSIDKENSVIYTGTHDNQTTKGWFNNFTQEEQGNMIAKLKSLGYDNKEIAHSFIEYALHSKAKFAIIPMQDILNLDDTARMNTPGTIGDPNWQWKMDSFLSFEQGIGKLKTMIISSNR